MTVGASVKTLVTVGEAVGLLVVPEAVGATVPIGMPSVGANEVVSMVVLAVVAGDGTRVRTPVGFAVVVGVGVLVG